MTDDQHVMLVASGEGARRSARGALNWCARLFENFDRTHRSHRDRMAAVEYPFGHLVEVAA